MVVARRFRCDTVLCGRRIFTERFEDGALAPWARRTARLDLVVHHLGLALGGRPAASFARRLMLPVSNDTMLRVVRRRGCPPFAAPSVIGFMTGHGGAISGTEQSSATSSGDDRLLCYPTESQLLRRLGSRGSRKLRWSRATAAVVTPLLWPSSHATQVADRWTFDGERQPRLPRCGPQIHAPGSCRGRCRHHKSCLADRR